MMVFTPASTELVLAFFFPFDVILYIFLKNVISYMHTCQGILAPHFLKHLSFLVDILYTPLLVLYKLCPKTMTVLPLLNCCFRTRAWISSEAAYPFICQVTCLSRVVLNICLCLASLFFSSLFPSPLILFCVFHSSLHDSLVLGIFSVVNFFFTVCMCVT